MTRTFQRKRAKVNNTAGGLEPPTKSNVRTPKLGRLSQLMSMPMDILVEIFGYLHPLDLLHLARTTKAFRLVLMHRSSLFMWKAALSTVPGLPVCPPDLSEPQWTNLVFDTHCSSCLRPNIRTIDWALRIRLCTECTKQRIVIRVDYVNQREDYHIVKRAVRTRPGKRGRQVLFIDECERVKTQYHAIENLDAREKFIAERERLLIGIHLHVELCVAWARSQERIRFDELNHLKSSRHQAIVDKLVGLGWGYEIDKMPGSNALKHHKLVKVPQLLTERIWANIRGTMIEYMEQQKADRLAREWRYLRTPRELAAVKLLQAYKTERAPLTNVMPEPLDFCTLGRIKELLDQPPDVNVDSESFLRLMPELDDIVGEWRRMILAKFIHQVKMGVIKRSIMLNDNPLDLGDASDQFIFQHIQLASTVFVCIPCEDIQGVDNSLLTPSRLATTSQLPQAKPLWYPHVLGHHCLTKPQKGAVADDTAKQFILPCHRQRWSCDSVITVDEEACKVAVAIIEACRMNPSIATVDEMDELDARLECLTCLARDVEDPFHVLSGWRSAVKHQRKRHPSDLGDWRMLTASEAEVARVEEVNCGVIAPKAMEPSNQKIWLCSHCVHGPNERSFMTLDKVESHVESRHGVEDPQMNHDYFRDFKSPKLYAPPTLFDAAMVKFAANTR